MYTGSSCGPMRIIRLQCEAEHRDAKRELQLEDGRGAATAKEPVEKVDDDAQDPAKKRYEEVKNRGDETGQHAATRFLSVPRSSLISERQHTRGAGGWKRSQSCLRTC